MTDELSYPSHRKGYLELALRRLSGLAPLAACEENAIRGLSAPRRSIGKGQELQPSGAASLYFLLDGWACRARSLDRGRRQIFDVILPGDIFGYLASEVGHPHYSVIALTNATIIEATALAATDSLGRPVSPGFMAALTGFRKQTQERILDHVVRLSARRAYESVGHLLVELYARQAQIGLASGSRLPFPIGQERLGEILGVSEAHINRTLTRLRTDGHLMAGPGWMALPKLEELAALVDYPLRPRSSGYSIWSGA